jgi:hypothetical protein
MHHAVPWLLACAVLLAIAHHGTQYVLELLKPLAGKSSVSPQVHMTRKSGADNAASARAARGPRFDIESDRSQSTH